MYWNDHNPPHFHVRYGDYNAVILIENFSLSEGWLPPKALALVIEWAAIHQKDLIENWERGKNYLTFNKIQPLE